MSRPKHDSNVQTHRMRFPNRKPLLVSAILVALTSVPTLVVVAAGSATLDRRDPVRTPTVEGLGSGPVIIEPGASGGIQDESPGAYESILAMPATRAPRPGRAPERAGGSGGGTAPGAGEQSGDVASTPRPEATCPASPDPTAPPAGEPAPQPPDPAAEPSAPRIDDQAWPGWDRGMRATPESVHQEQPGRPASSAAAPTGAPRPSGTRPQGPASSAPASASPGTVSPAPSVSG